MRNITPILRTRRERRLARRQRNEARLSVTGWSVGFVISILLAALILRALFRQLNFFPFY
jgi:threonine/homoserine/homoserine lactone efflux protein